MPRKRCIWATSLPWTSPFRVSAHHYARVLAEDGWDVAFLSHPISPLHAVRSRSRSGTRERFGNWRIGGEETLDGHVFHYCPLTLCPPHDLPLLRSARALDLWPKMTMPGVRGVLAERGFDDVDLLVIDTARYSFLLDTVTSRTSVFRVVDAIGGFESTPPSWIERTNAILKRVDHVIVTSSVLQDDVRERGARSVTYVPNGVEVEHFTTGSVEPPPEYGKIASPRAVYVGAIESWFDVELVRATADALPHVAFVLIGPVATDVAVLQSTSNVHILGARAYENLPRYLANADVGLIPFRSSALTRSVNPIKLYEYMACGLPVVATRSDTLEKLHCPARLAGSTAEFVHEVAEVTAKNTTPVDRGALIEFARRADWRIRAAHLLEAVGCDVPVGTRGDVCV